MQVHATPIINVQKIRCRQQKIWTKESWQGGLLSSLKSSSTVDPWTAWFWVRFHLWWWASQGVAWIFLTCAICHVLKQGKSRYLKLIIFLFIIICRHLQVLLLSTAMECHLNRQVKVQICLRYYAKLMTWHTVHLYILFVSGILLN